MKHIRFAVLLSSTTLSVLSSPALPCSVCRCGDDGLQMTQPPLASAQRPEFERLRLSLSHTYSSKSNALGSDEGVGTESQREYRPAVRGFYQVTRQLSVSAEIPLTVRRLAVASNHESSVKRSTGFGDLELTGAWKRGFSSVSDSSVSVGFSAALKIPMGQNSLTSDGKRLDEHLQAGTGSYDYTLGGGLARTLTNGRVFVSAYFRHNGTNNYAYHYGHATLFNVGAQRSLKPWLQGILQLNTRYARRDTDHEDTVGNTGGWVGYVTPGARFELQPSTSLSISVQIPVWQDLYGTQSEKSVLTTALSVGM